jgi:hypothetical protein
MSESEHHRHKTERDVVPHPETAEELRAPRAIKTFGFFLVGVVVLAFLLMLGTTLMLRGWSQASSAYVRPATWLFLALCAPMSAQLTAWYLKRHAIEATACERSCMLVASRAVAVSFLAIGILALANG